MTFIHVLLRPDLAQTSGAMGVRFGDAEAGFIASTASDAKIFENFGGKLRDRPPGHQKK